MMKRKILYTLTFSLCLQSSASMGWGGRGHDSITLVASKIAESKYPAEFSKPFQIKSVMLSHLANIPDTYWKSFPKELTSVLNPTHYIDMELIAAKPDLRTLPFTIDATVKQIQARCKSGETLEGIDCHGPLGVYEVLTAIGSAPWRIEQIANLTRDEFVKLKSLQAGGTTPNENWQKQVDSALLYAGLLSHFVGDLSQPLHASKDYDSWGVKQGGLHEYYETEVIDASDFNLEQDALVFARRKAPAQLLMKSLIKAGRESSATTWDPAGWGLALANDSFAKKGLLEKLDRRSLIEPSSIQGETKQKAKRPPAKKVISDYHRLSAERLAYSADLLALIWFRAWEEAGKPDLSFYRSYTFHLQPEPITADYLGTAAPQAR